MISVIVPVYNVEKYLNKCLDSILNQTYTNFELILVDDGSKDNSGKICDEYAQKDDRVKVFHIENQGVSNARNVGIDNANGEYIAFVDSDDTVQENFLQRARANIKNYDLYVAGIKKIIVEDGNVISEEEYSGKTGVYSVKDLFENVGTNISIMCTSGPCNKLFLTNVIKLNHILFDTNRDSGEDTIFVIDYCKKIRITYFDNFLCYNYFNEIKSNSLNNKERENKLEINHDINTHFYNFLDEIGCSDSRLEEGSINWEKDNFLHLINYLVSNNYNLMQKKEKITVFNNCIVPNLNISKFKRVLNSKKRLLYFAVKYNKKNIAMFLVWCFNKIKS